ncbi:MAG: hypothetical protein ACRC14_04785 [Paracoccaceae bacterium]
MKIMALDTATKTGIAIGETGGKPICFTVDLGKVDWPVRFSRTLRMTRKLIEEHRPDLVAVEAFVGGPKANSNLVGLVACVQGETARMGVRLVSYYPATIRSHFLGGIRASKVPIKTQVFQRCRLLGWDVKDLDASDAAALFDYACSVESRAHQMTSLPGMFAGVVR